MNVCDEYAVDLLQYIDEELGGSKLEQFLAHLQTCPRCKESLEQQLTLSASLRHSRPLYRAPENLRARIDAEFAHSRSGVTSVRPYGYAPERIRRALLRVAHTLLQRNVLVPAIPLVALCLLLASNAIRRVRAAEYVQTALSTHQNYLAGDLPLEYRSSSSQEVSGWLAGKVPFPFRLPVSQEESDREHAYRLLGATLINYRGGLAALVTYEGRQKDAISLLVAASNRAVAAGGVEVRSRGLVFHYRSDSGFQVITWSTHGLTYALVSRANGSARGSCLVCHQSMTDRKVFPATP